MPSVKWLERIFLICNVLVIAFCSLRVPWHEGVPNMPYIRLGYSWLWRPPDEAAAPDLSATILQLGACIIVGAAIFLLIRRWKRT